MKLHCVCTPFEAMPPEVWRAFRKMVQSAASSWGLNVDFEEGPTVTAAIANFWRMNQAHEDSHLAKTEDA